MTKEITMPRLSETMVDGKVLSWHKKINDRINKGDTLAEVETDKANMEVDAVDSGVLSEIIVREGQTAKVGEPIAILDGQKKPEIQPKEQLEVKHEQPEEMPTEEEEKTEPKVPKISHKGPAGVKASPLAKKLAEKMNVNLSDVMGTGPGGRIREQDIYDYLEKAKKPEEKQPELNIQPLSRMRQTIAQRMTQSKQNIPHFYLTYEVNTDKLMDFYREISEKNNDITLNDIFIKAVALTLQKHPVFNASFEDNNIEMHEKINIGIAFAVEEGLLVPVVHNCIEKSLAEISAATRTIKDRIKTDKLKPEDMTGGTFTISNLGMYGVKDFLAIINPPEIAGLAIGSVMKVPTVKNDQMVVGNILNLTLSADHRAVDGVKSALFLKDLKDFLENPNKIE